MPDIQVTAHGLKKRFGKVQAVDGVSLEVTGGKCLGLLGPNGAGKTTTVSIIAGLLSPDEGQVTVDGAALSGDADPKKRRIGLVPQDLALYDELAAADNLRCFGGLYDLTGAALAQAIQTQLQFVGLADRARDKVKTFSGGMKRRLNLAASLLHDPALLILDEPTVGVDPQSRSAIFDNLEALKARGKAILYTTHYMEEAERLCDWIVIVDQGKVVADDNLRGLYRRMPARRRMRIELAEGSPPPAADALRALAGVEAVEPGGDAVIMVTLGEPAVAGTVLSWLAEHGHVVEYFATERPDLEDVFLQLTGRNLRDA